MNAYHGLQQFNSSIDCEAYPSTQTLPRDVLLELIDLIGLAIILTDTSGQIVHMNKAARQLLGDNDVIQQCHGRLRAFSRKSSADLQSALSLAAGNVANLPRQGIAVPLHDSDGAVRAASWVLPLRSQSGATHEHGDGRFITVIIRELTREATISSEFFARCYGITNAETRLLELLAEGLTVLEAGQLLEVSSNTARTHLRNLFAKTGTHRQAELMRLATTTLPPAFVCSQP